jgi:hypothetical protein
MLVDDGQGSLAKGFCTQGPNDADSFGQVGACNAPQWFVEANKAVAAGKLVVLPLGKQKNG